MPGRSQYVRANDIAAVKSGVYRSFIESLPAHGKPPLCARKVLRLYGAERTNYIGSIAMW